MKTSLRRWRGFSLHKHGGDAKERRDLRLLGQLDELAQASQDMQDMSDCYDNLLSAAAATANSAFEFSESLQDFGACLLEKTALNDNEESGKVLLMLGKVQFELQKLVDSYRSHIFQTITNPSESLLNELRTVEEMKRQCDEKRNVYYMAMRQREKGRSKSGKGETFSMQQLQEAHDEYDQVATLFVFRLKSLKQGQSRSLLTQAARHHAAQLYFFKKALKCLEALEPHVKKVTEQQHIDYQFSGLEDDDLDDGVDDDNGSDSHGEGELSFDNIQNDQEQDSVSPSRKSMELDQADITLPKVPTLDTAKEYPGQSYRKYLSFKREIRISSQSAPLFVENKSDTNDRRKQMRPSSSRKFNSYVLPTPGDTKSSQFKGPGSPVPCTLNTSLSGQYNLWHSSPLDPIKFDNSLGDEKISRATAQSGLRESTDNNASTRLPPPPSDGLLFLQFDPCGTCDSKKVKRQAFSGPLTGKPWPTKSVSKEHPQLSSGPFLRNLGSQPPGLSPKVSPSASHTFTSSPRINELHELPRPPSKLTLKSSMPMGLVDHSSPLLPKSQVLSAPSKSVMSNAASQLPKRPQAITHSFSIPSSSHKMALRPLTPISLTNKNPSPAGSESVAQPVEIRGNLESSALVSLEMASPPLTPISLTNKNPSPAGSESVAQPVEIRGNPESSALVSLASLTFSRKPNMAGVDIQVASGSFASFQFRSHIDSIMTF